MLPPRPVASALDAIGNTPVVQLQRLVPPGSAAVFVKLEGFNPTGSYEDRMALAMIEEAENRGALTRDLTVVEYTCGSTGSSLAFVCAAKGYKFHAVSSDAFAATKLNTIRAFGAELTIVHSPSGEISAALMREMMTAAAAIAAEGGCYQTDQFNNRDSLIGYAGIGQELVAQFPEGIDCFCGAVGTAGLLMGVAGVLREFSQDTRIVALEPASTPVITEGHSGQHHIDGIGVGFVPPLLDRELYDDVRVVDEDVARSICRQLAEKEGLLVGTSSGVNIAAALDLARQLGPGKVVVTVACDTGLKYLDDNLFADAHRAREVMSRRRIVARVLRE
ncbi:cysteine synthase family protein [Salinibacterium sp. G-O1]|uniref:PLP-dependent cysteine synthase family protein n=1 Tax=Salinibacterium sp. G-O1 TaxID=3046208 RepID=UPI0024B9A08E|nr:cysteine synthase family protein [Salinibacterium sp. G-O1]MDJ0334771.1 cysteine synthase family protein [Salinibacterium sp. G-O1]